MSESTQKIQTERQELIEDPHRPLYHFLPPTNWMNDPNGLIHWKGQYHLFYQYNPYSPVHGNIHWGHAASSDLIHWTDLPIALTPTSGRADADGCWSGCAIDNNGVPTLLYTAVYPQVVCLATSSDDLLTWQYFPENPVIAGPPSALIDAIGGDFRDPFAWKENDSWYLLMGSKQKGLGGMLLLYRSQDLTTWEYLHPLLVGKTNIEQSLWMGEMWECPNFLTFGDQRALIFSIQGSHENEPLYPVYVTGVFQDEQFLPQSQGIVAYGGYFYAPQVVLDKQGRYIMWGWLMEGGLRNSEARWAGAMSLPIIVAPLPEGKLSLQPVPELTILRGENWHYQNLALSQTKILLRNEQWNDHLEILLELEPGPDSDFGLILRTVPGGQAFTTLTYQSQSHHLSLECEQAPTNPPENLGLCSTILEQSSDQPVTFHLFLDGSILEVFVNNTCYLASRVYPEHHATVAIELFTRKGESVIKSFDLWHLASIWKRPLQG